MKDVLLTLSREMGLSLTERQIEQFDLYARLLVEWNEKMNLTAITEPEEIARKHFIDSLVGWETIKAKISACREKGRALKLIDVGTGAGFPGLPIKILFPEIELTLLDSLGKRVTFLETVVRELELTGVSCIHARAEEAAHLPEMREQYDIAVARAVAALPVLTEAAFADMVRMEGTSARVPFAVFGEEFRYYVVKDGYVYYYLKASGKDMKLTGYVPEGGVLKEIDVIAGDGCIAVRADAMLPLVVYAE